MKSTEAPINGQASIVTKEASREVDIKGGEPMTNQKYRMLTEDEILGLNKGRKFKFNWSKRMDEESNLLYRLKYSKGNAGDFQITSKITQSFIDGVIESLENAGDFQITSVGHTKYILFVAGKQPPMPDEMNMFDQRKKALKRLYMNFELWPRFLESRESASTYQVSKVGYLPESRKNTLFVTLKSNIFFWIKHWGME